MTRQAMVPPLYLVIDQGGHASRAMLFDAKGHKVASSHVEVQTHRPRPGWVEHDAAAVLRSVQQAVQIVWEDAHRPLVAAAGLATQRATIVCWDRRTGLPLSPAISWQDTRGASYVEQLQQHGDEVRQRTGLTLSSHYGASKLRWCVDHLPEVRHALSEGCLACGPLASYLLYGLLQERPLIVDPANASRTLLWDLARGDWSVPLLKLFAILRQVLPQCVWTEHAFGHLRLGSQPVVLRVCTGDQSAVPFGMGWPDRGTAYINLGTGAFIQRMIDGEPVMASPLLTSVLWACGHERLYVLEGTVNGAGSAIDQVAGELGLDKAVVLEARPENHGIPLFLNGISGLGSPFWRPRFESRFVGVGDAAPPQRMQAVLESILFLLAVNLQVMSQVSSPLNRIMITGGLSASDRICQGLADLVRLAIERPADIQATARGLAYLVARSSDWADESDLPTTFEPSDNAPLRRRFDLWRRAMDEVLL